MFGIHPLPAGTCGWSPASAATSAVALYRRFPDRKALIRGVVLDAIRGSAADARRAAQEEPDAYAALVRYMHDAIDARTAAVIPALLGEIDFADEEIARARAESPSTIEPLVESAKRAGALRADVTAGDIGMLIVRMTRPLPGPFPAEMNNGLSHRHLALLIDGLRPAAREPALPGPVLSMADLRGMATPASGSHVRAAGDAPLSLGSDSLGVTGRCPARYRLRAGQARHSGTHPSTRAPRSGPGVRYAGVRTMCCGANRYIYFELQPGLFGLITRRLQRHNLRRKNLVMN